MSLNFWESDGISVWRRRWALHCGQLNQFVLEYMNSASSALESGGLAHISQWGKAGSEQYMLPARWHLFQLRSCIFQKDNAQLYAAFITAARICNRIEMWVLNWPAGILHSSNHGPAAVVQLKMNDYLIYCLCSVVNVRLWDLQIIELSFYLNFTQYFLEELGLFIMNNTEKCVKVPPDKKKNLWKKN